MAQFLTTLRTLVLVMIASLPNTADAGEGAASNYFPGAYGYLLVAMPPDPGFIVGSLNLSYSAHASQAVSGGQITVGLDAAAVYSYSQLLHTWESPWLGGRFTAGISFPVGYASTDSTVIGAFGAQTSSISASGLGDMVLIPASFYWNKGNLYFNLYESIVAPTGKYDPNSSINVGRNYWSSDTVLAMTWFDPQKGSELSIVTGIMINSRNKDTDYKTGTEFHADLLFNQFVSESTAIGIHGYGYYQISGDSGSGALLGDFKGRSWGLGPAITYIPPKYEGRLVLSAKYLKDISATNRLKANYGVFNLNWIF